MSVNPTTGEAGAGYYCKYFKVLVHRGTTTNTKVLAINEAASKVQHVSTKATVLEKSRVEIMAVTFITVRNNCNVSTDCTVTTSPFDVVILQWVTRNVGVNGNEEAYPSH